MACSEGSMVTRSSRESLTSTGRSRTGSSGGMHLVSAGTRMPIWAPLCAPCRQSASRRSWLVEGPLGCWQVRLALPIVARTPLAERDSSILPQGKLKVPRMLVRTLSCVANDPMLSHVSIPTKPGAQ